MKEETYSKVRKNYLSLKDSLQQYQQNSDRADCDKFDLGFNLDNRFTSGKESISLDSWLGYFGSSSCSRAIRIYDWKAFSPYLIQALNKNINLILESAILEMKADLVSHKEILQNEINTLQNELDELKDL